MSFFPLAWTLALALAAPPQGSVRLDVRAFDGTTEVSSRVRLAVYPAGRHERPVATAAAGRTVPGVVVEPGEYDVQVVWERPDGASRLVWAEELSVLRYPDEPSRHLEVVNFDPSYGALEVVVPDGVARRSREGEGGATLRASEAGPGTPASAPLAGEGYLLFVVRGGRYDLEVDIKGSPPKRRTVADIEVPSGRTRLTVVR